MEISLRQAADLLRNADTLVLTAHVHPDGDSLGSMLGLYLALQAEGKKVYLLLDDVVPASYQFLPQWRKITKIGDNDRLNPDLLVVLDASDLERIGKVNHAVRAPILNIDHHISNTMFADYTYLDKQASATGEIITELLKMLAYPITADIGDCLYTAIATDCGFFRYANTSAATLRYAAELVEAGAKPQFISEELERRPLSNLVTLTKVLQTIELHHNGEIATMSISRDLVQDPSESTEGFINYARSIDGVEVAILLKAIDDRTVRVSFRSHRVDVSKIALSFGGGGHIRAAGCTVYDNLANAQAKVVAATTEQIR